MNNNLEKDFRLFAKDHHVSMQTLNDYIKHTNRFIEPTIIEERQMNVTQIGVFSRLMMERILFIGSEIDSDLANIVNSQLLFLETEQPKKAINLYINSPGGSVPDGMSIYDVCKYISCPISTTCCGTAASMAAILLSSGDKGMRYALPHSQIMIHQPSGGTGRVSASDMEIVWKEMEKCKQMLYEVLSENTGRSIKDITTLCDRDKWLTPDECLPGVFGKYGIIDKVHISKKK